MKPGTKAMKVSAQRANKGCVRSARSCIQAEAATTLIAVQRSATVRAMLNFQRIDT